MTIDKKTLAIIGLSVISLILIGIIVFIAKNGTKEPISNIEFQAEHDSYIFRIDSLETLIYSKSLRLDSIDVVNQKLTKESAINKAKYNKVLIEYKNIISSYDKLLEHVKADSNINNNIRIYFDILYKRI